MAKHNLVGIQLLSNAMRNSIFKKRVKEEISDPKIRSKVVAHLEKFDIPHNRIQNCENIDFELPPLKGNSIDQHFKIIAEEQTKPYVDLLDKIIKNSLPLRPRKWTFKEGWTKYDLQIKKSYPVEYPDDNILVMDVESYVPTGGHPLLATAVSPTAWYSWCSKYLFSQPISSDAPSLEDLIRFSNDPSKEMLFIGHNVSFDRSLIRDQYQMEPSKTNFLDTMSLHIALSGFTSYQRMMYISAKANKTKPSAKNSGKKSLEKFEDRSWMSKGCMNNLNDVYQFHCKKEPLDKQLRDIFVDGKLQDIKDNFQDLMKYCSDDVKATHEVLKKLWPEFQNRFPHPVTLAGMFEMGNSFLPVNESWFKYIRLSEEKFDSLQQQNISLLNDLADEAKLKSHDKSYEDDLWLWDLDWSMKSKRLKSAAVSEDGKKSMKSQLTPKWYLEQCVVDPNNNNLVLSNLSLQKRTALKLLRLTWKGFPLHYSARHGWGYLVPYNMDGKFNIRKEDILNFDENAANLFPLNSMIEHCNRIQHDVKNDLVEKAQAFMLEKVLSELRTDTSDDGSYLFADDVINKKKELGGTEEIPIPNVVPGCLFYKLPHKDGDDKNVGNPLSKSFHNEIDHGTLHSMLGKHVDDILKQGSISSYWKNNLKRIKSQLVIQLNSNELPKNVKSAVDYKDANFYGAIIPRVISAGTVTRRAVEPTWLTASNAYSDRIGSELKSIIQSPPGFSFVGADVDSQELWIAALLGDAHFAGIHGCTAFGWMTLQGNKADGTDMHSRTAEMVGISRDHAKIFNYGRIYGAGLKFAEKMLLKFNSSLTREEANSRATKMFHATKGKKKYYGEYGSNDSYSWEGGSESYMFNELEKIASSEEPKTPVLAASMSTSLEPKSVGQQFMTSRVNWVVQSSAVDYLHLMLVCMKWLFNEYKIKGRFCISIHDEVRYLVDDEDKYRAALALQITNLFTRSMFAHQLNFDDLPQSVAFFSSVEIDKCLRKDAKDDCITPSNERGLQEEYGIPKGESLTMSEILEKTSGDLTSCKETTERYLENESLVRTQASS